MHQEWSDPIVGFEHSMKNELIMATKKEGPRQRAADRLNWILEELNLKEMTERFSTAIP